MLEQQRKVGEPEEESGGPGDAAFDRRGTAVVFDFFRTSTSRCESVRLCNGAGAVKFEPAMTARVICLMTVVTVS